MATDVSSDVVAEKEHFIKTYDFLDMRDDNVFTVFVQEMLDVDYSLYVWPSAPVLAQFVICNQHLLLEKNIVELGSGTALAGIVAAKCGASTVTLSDHADKTKTLLNCEKMIELNGFSANQVRVVGLTWGYYTPELFALRGVDIILAADCFYDTKDFESVFMMVSFLLEANPRAQFWCTYQVRSTDRSFEYLLTKWNMVCRHVHLEEFTEHIEVVCREGNSRCNPMHEIQMLIFTLKDN